MRQIDDRRVLTATGALIRTSLLAAGVGVLALGAAGCGGGGGSAPKPVEGATLYVKTFNLPNYSGVYLDEDLVIQTSAPVLEDSINPDSIQFRTGAAGGTSPFGVFVRGVFMVDPATGTRVVVDPDRFTPNLLNQVERRNQLTRIPDEFRIDLGYDEAIGSNGGRRPLFDRSRSSVVTFVPEVPTRAALDDTGLTAASTYTVAVPGYPSTNTLENMSGRQLLSVDNRIFTSTFTTVAATAPQLFLGSESAGIPRVIHTDPFNGKTLVPVTATIFVRFSHPLDPRTVTPDKFTVEVISVPAPYPVIPVSVFLAQQRLGKVEVSLTPINPLPADAVIRVTLDSGIEDLVGKAMVQSNISFTTGAGAPVQPPTAEEFVNNTLEDPALTSANWNNSKPYVGGLAGSLTAAFAPYAGDGSDGAFNAPVGQTTSIGTGGAVQRVFNFTSFSVPIGATVVANGKFPLVIHCQGAVDISGNLLLDGADGKDGYQGNDSNGLATGGAGGLANAGGGAGGNGAMATTGGAGNIDGLDGFGSGAGLGGFTGENDGSATNFWPRTDVFGNPQPYSTPPFSYEPARQREGGGGGGNGTSGTSASNVGATLLGRNGSSVPNGGLAGPSFGNGSLTDTATASTSATVQVIDPQNPGGPLKTITLNGIPTLVQAGSGGGGGGGEDDKDTNTNLWGTPDGADEGGGGGGAGGGGVQIVSYTTINVAGRISANGGNGGNSYVDSSASQFSQGAGGGGGSGGIVWLQCRGIMTFQPGSVVTVDGGTGGQGNADGTTLVYTAGSGGLGRVRVEDKNGNPSNAPAVASTGVFSPALDLDSVGTSKWQSTGFFTPQFDQPVIVAATNGVPGSTSAIRVFLEGAQELLGNSVDDPDTANSTGWIKVYDSDLGGILGGDPWTILNNNKWYRYKVEFHVDGFASFSSPLPAVDSLLVAYHQ